MSNKPIIEGRKNIYFQEMTNHFFSLHSSPQGRKEFESFLRAYGKGALMRALGDLQKMDHHRKLKFIPSSKSTTFKLTMKNRNYSVNVLNTFSPSFISCKRHGLIQVIIVNTNDEAARLSEEGAAAAPDFHQCSHLLQFSHQVFNCVSC